MKDQSFLDYLQNLSHSAKSRIILVAVIISVIGFGSLWVNDVRNNFVGIDTSDIIPKGAVLSATTYITIESYEERDDKRYIYFKVENNTSEILNFSKNDQITLELNDQTISPESVTDRQQSTFVTKILSNSTIYGTLIFNQFDGDEGTLTFDEMFFENQPGNLFRESIEVDFGSLKPVEELRS